MDTIEARMNVMDEKISVLGRVIEPEEAVFSIQKIETLEEFLDNEETLLKDPEAFKLQITRVIGFGNLSTVGRTCAQFISMSVGNEALKHYSMCGKRSLEFQNRRFADTLFFKSLVEGLMLNKNRSYQVDIKMIKEAVGGVLKRAKQMASINGV